MNLHRTDIDEASAREFALSGSVLFMQSGKVSARRPLPRTEPPSRQKSTGPPRSVGMSGVHLKDLTPQSKAALFSGKSLDIYDVRGRILFRDFVTPVKGGREMRVRTSANSLLGSPVVSTLIGEALPIGAWLVKAESLALQRGLVPWEGPERLVCYSYPKLGLLCLMRAQKRKYVVDLADLSVVSVEDKSSGDSAPDLLKIWSPLDKPSPSAKERWRGGVEVLQRRLTLGSNLADIVSAVQEAAPPHVLDKMVLHPQSTEANCSAAAAWMILDYYQIPIDPGHVTKIRLLSTLLNVGPNGATNDDQIKAYKALFNNFRVSLVANPGFDQAVSEIDGGRPLKSGIEGHARAVAGWKTETSAAGVTSSLLIYDPYPTNQGQILWETWGAIPYTDYILVQQQKQQN